MVKGATTAETPLTSTRLNTFAPMTLPETAHRALGQRGDGRDQLRQRGAQRHKGERDHRLRHAQCLRDQCAVIHQQVRAHGNEHRAHGQQTQLLGKGSIFIGLLRFFRGGGIFHSQHVAHDVSHEHGQQDQPTGRVKEPVV